MWQLEKWNWQNGFPVLRVRIVTSFLNWVSHWKSIWRLINSTLLNITAITPIHRSSFSSKLSGNGNLMICLKPGQNKKGQKNFHLHRFLNTFYSWQLRKSIQKTVQLENVLALLILWRLYHLSGRKSNLKHTSCNFEQKRRLEWTCRQTIYRLNCPQTPRSFHIESFSQF